MEQRIQIDEIEPEAYKGMYIMENYLAECGLSKSHKELIRIRASQINGCAFCIHMHAQDAIKNGETKERIFLLDAWKETDLFSKEEKIILSMTEEITLITQKGLSPETYQKATKIFDQNYIAKIIIAITTINMWNRLLISTNKPLIS
jgi:AhpD family alkylhydroperoxidase